jgi:Prokaryotic RING finger family 1
MHFVFGFLVFIFFILRSVVRWGMRGSRRINSHGRAREVFEDLVRQYGGNTYRGGWRKLIYVTPDRSAELQIDSDAHRMVLRLRKPVSGRFSFYRLPRLAYAFLDAFLEPRYKLKSTHYLIGSNSAEMLGKLQIRQGFLPLMRKMNDLGFSGQMGPFGIKLWKSIRFDEINDLNLMNYVRLAQDLGKMSDAEFIHIPVQPLTSEKWCAYCKELLSESDSVQYCQWCGTPHHKECFELNGGCTVYGCEQPLAQQQVLVNDGSVAHR